jgi:hypothetical protein
MINLIRKISEVKSILNLFIFACVCTSSFSQTANTNCAKNAFTDTNLVELKKLTESVVKDVDQMGLKSLPESDLSFWIPFDNKVFNTGTKIQNFRHIHWLYQLEGNIKTEAIDFGYQTSFRTMSASIELLSKHIRIIIPRIKDAGFAQILIKYRADLEKININLLLCKL